MSVGIVFGHDSATRASRWYKRARPKKTGVTRPGAGNKGGLHASMLSTKRRAVRPTAHATSRDFIGRTRRLPRWSTASGSVCATGVHGRGGDGEYAGDGGGSLDARRVARRAARALRAAPMWWGCAGGVHDGRRGRASQGAPCARAPCFKHTMRSQLRHVGDEALAWPEARMHRGLSLRTHRRHLPGRG